MLELTPEAIKDFQVCNLYYNYKFNDKLSIPIQKDNLLYERFQNTLKRVIAYFFYKKQSYLSVSYNSFLNKWERLWYPKNIDAYDIMNASQDVKDNEAFYTTQAASILLDFYETFKDYEGFPLFVNEKFSIPITKTAKLNSSFDLVLQQKEDTYTVIKWVFSRFKPLYSTYALDLTSQRLAWEFRNVDKQLDVQYYLYNLSTVNPGLFNVHPAPKDITALIYWVKTIESTDNFVPRRGYTVYCRTCAYDQNCLNYHFPEI